MTLPAWMMTRVTDGDAFADDDVGVEIAVVADR